MKLIKLIKKSVGSGKNAYRAGMFKKRLCKGKTKYTKLSGNHNKKLIMIHTNYRQIRMRLKCFKAGADFQSAPHISPRPHN